LRGLYKFERRLNMEYVLEMIDISKSFSGVKAIDKVSFSLKAGTVHTLMGENGAGKSTLMKILSGIHKSDNGRIILRGNEVLIDSPMKALNLGISMIHQELTPISEMTIAENIFLGREPTKHGFLDYKKLSKMTKELLERIDIKLNPSTLMKDLKVSDVQLIEIAKAVSYDSDIIVMDEPTSAITEKEVRNLFRVINDLRNSGKSIIYISHKMNEVFEISDYITVFRDGRYIDTKAGKEIEQSDIIRMMVGRELKDVYPQGDSNCGDVLLSVKNITQKKKFNNISFDVKKGEILGIAGLMGAGRTEVMEAIYGLTPIDSGEIFIDDKKVNITSPKDAIDNGIAFVTEDRKLEGIILPLSVKENITMPSLSSVSDKVFVKKQKEIKVVDEYIESLKIKTTGREQVIQSLSGGNQQKVVIAKCLMTKPKILILDEPTRGIDIGSKSEIYKLMKKFAAEGFAIIMISSELPEIIGMSDRIIVFSRGRVAGELSKSEATQVKIMELAM
jgi:inositol transport system ATP-binding protein